MLLFGQKIIEKCLKVIEVDVATIKVYFVVHFESLCFEFKISKLFELDGSARLESLTGIKVYFELLWALHLNLGTEEWFSVALTHLLHGQTIFQVLGRVVELEQLSLFILSNLLFLQKDTVDEEEQRIEEDDGTQDRLPDS